MPRYKLILEYDGTKFFGFQKQNNLITVQSTLENAINKLSNIPVKTYCAGRTDTGVHATHQVVHFDMERDIISNKLKLAINFHIKPNFVSILSAENLGNDTNFNARFSAIERWYEYKILQQEHLPTFNRHLYWWIKNLLDVKAMHEAAQYLVGKHDFTTFRSKGCVAKSPIRTINEIVVQKIDNIISIRIKAPSFLYHQVRNIVGSLVLVGNRRWSKDHIKKILLEKNPKLRGPIAEAQGLYLINIVY